MCMYMCVCAPTYIAQQHLGGVCVCVHVCARHSGIFVNGVCMCVLTGMAQQHLGDVCVPVN